MTKPITLSTLRRMKREGEPIAMLTAYDAAFARLMDQAGVDVLLVGDSLGMVVQGRSSTVPVTLDEMVYHTALVNRGRHRALLVADLPFLSHTTPEQALMSAARLMKEGGAEVVKLEGGTPQLETVRRLAEAGVPVCAHLGLLPQSVHKLGGYKVQGRDADGAERIRAEARAMEQAGADLLILECVPRPLAGAISAELGIPVVGIGAGPECDGQVLVSYDILGLVPAESRPSFSRDYLTPQGSLAGAFAAYVTEVKGRAFPTDAESFH